MNRDDYVNVQWSPIPIRVSVSRVFDCNTLVLQNQGTQNVTINGVYLLTPGQGFTFEGYPGEMNIQNYDIIFDNDRNAGALVVAWVKIYQKRSNSQR